MVLRIDPRFPLVWRSPTSMQFGIDRPRIVLEQVTSATERVIAALVVGVSESGAEMIAQDAGLDVTGLRELLTRLDSVLFEPSRPRRARVMVAGQGETATAITAFLRIAGVAVVDETSESTPDVVCILADFVIDPELHGRWLRRDIPHLPVVFGDEVVRIGPLVRPGFGPCLYCLELYRCDADPAWTAIAAQLWGRRTRAVAPIVVSEVATAAVWALLASLDDRDDGVFGTSVDLDSRTGRRVSRSWLPHPRCGCISLNVAAAEDARLRTAAPETAMLSAVGRGPIRLLPRTGGGADARG